MVIFAVWSWAWWEQRHQAVLEVLNDGASVTDVARRHGVARQTDERTVRIDKSVTATTKDGIVIKSTKTGRVRPVSLTQQASCALVDLRGRTPATADTDLRSPPTLPGSGRGDPRWSRADGSACVRRGESDQPLT